MTREAFREYYETRHRRIGEQMLAGFATRCVRRYLSATDGFDGDHYYDVVMEIDFPASASAMRASPR